MKYTQIQDKKYLLLETDNEIKEVIGLPVSLIKDKDNNEYVGAELPNPIPQDLINKYPILLLLVYGVTDKLLPYIISEKDVIVQYD